MALEHYILDGHKPKREPNEKKWGKFYSNRTNLRVDFTLVPHGHVSTIFLGIDHNFSGKGAPVLFETMAFIAGDGDSVCVRTCTWEEAQAAHDEMVNYHRLGTTPVIQSQTSGWNPSLNRVTLTEPMLLTDGTEAEFGKTIL